MTLIQCPSCKIDNPLNSKACSACNFKFTKKCVQNCLSKYPLSANFCSNCGRKLEFVQQSLKITTQNEISASNSLNQVKSPLVKESVLKVKVNIVEGENKNKVEINDGGGWRTIRLLNTLNFIDICSKIIDLYFPEGDKVNKLGDKKELKIGLLDFKKEPIDLFNDKTILNEYQDKYGLTTSRTYFFLWLNRIENNIIEKDIKESETLTNTRKRTAPVTSSSSSSSSSSESSSESSSDDETIFKKNNSLIKKNNQLKTQITNETKPNPSELKKSVKSESSSDESVECLHANTNIKSGSRLETLKKAQSQINPPKEIFLSVKSLHTKQNTEEISKKFDQTDNSLRTALVQNLISNENKTQTTPIVSSKSETTSRVTQIESSSSSSSSSSEDSSSSDDEPATKPSLTVQKQLLLPNKQQTNVPSIQKPQKKPTEFKNFDAELLSDDSIEILTSSSTKLSNKIKTSFSGVNLSHETKSNENSFAKDPEPDINFSSQNSNKNNNKHYQQQQQQHSSYNQRRFNAKQNFRYDDKNRNNYQNNRNGQDFNNEHHQSSHIVKKIKLTETTMYQRNESHFKRNNNQNNFKTNANNHYNNRNKNYQKPLYDQTQKRNFSAERQTNQTNKNSFNNFINKKKNGTNSLASKSILSNLNNQSDDSDNERQNLKIKTVKDLKN